MTISDWLQKGTQKLEAAGIGTAHLDVLVLLEDALGKDRSWLLAHPEMTVQGSTLYSLGRKIRRRAQHEPLAYIRGKTEFYGREFMVNKHVLEPRPESETMIDLALKVIGYRLKVIAEKRRVMDVGTGSGALAITAKLEVPDAEVVATDIDPKCLKISRQNARKLEADVKFLQGDLLEPLYNLKPITYNLILANLPYVPDAFTINQAAMNEPRHAIFGGPDGLDLYRRLFGQIKALPVKPQYVVTESLPFQHEQLTNIAQSAGYQTERSADFIQVFQAGSRI
jgi:release factor glutamine methyltransferase